MRKTLFSVAALALTFTLTACNGSDDDKTPTMKPSPTASETPKTDMPPEATPSPDASASPTETDLEGMSSSAMYDEIMKIVKASKYDEEAGSKLARGMVNFAGDNPDKVDALVDDPNSSLAGVIMKAAMGEKLVDADYKTVENDPKLADLKKSLEAEGSSLRVYIDVTTAYMNSEALNATPATP